MLWALALLGLVPAAFAIGEFSSAGDKASEDENTSDDAAADTANDTYDLPDVVDLLDPDSLNDGLASDAEDGGKDYDVAVGSGETVFSDFSAGEDQVTLTVEDGGQGAFIVEPYLDDTGEETGTSLSYVSDDEETVLSFLGYDTIPADDISVTVLDPDSGETTLYAVNDLGDFGAIAPNDPEIPAEPFPSGHEGDETPLETNDPNTVAEPGPAGSVMDDPRSPVEDETDAPTGTMTSEVVNHVLSDVGETLVLADDAMQGGTDAILTRDDTGTPTITTEGTLNIVTGGAGDDAIATGDDAAIVDAGAGNDTIFGGDGTAILSGGEGDDTLYAGNDPGSAYVLSGDAGADALYGGDQDDTLIMDVEDHAEGGAGADEFWLYYDANADVGHARITDFSEGEDMLRVTLDPDDSYDGAVTVQVSPTPDGASSQVVVNGDIVAVLYGTPNASIDDVYVEISPTVLSS